MTNEMRNEMLKEERVTELLIDLELEYDDNTIFQNQNGSQRTMKEHAQDMVNQAEEFQAENPNLYFYTCLTQIMLDDETEVIL